MTKYIGRKKMTLMTLVDRLLKYSKKCVTERLDEDFARAVREAAEEIDDRSIKRCYNCQNCQALIEVYAPLGEDDG